MKSSEFPLLQKFLRKAFGNAAILVTPDPKNPRMGQVKLGERNLGKLSVDDEDGDRSFAFDIRLPVQRETLLEYLRMLFENPALKLVARGKKLDSVELNNGDEFLGVISADDAKMKSWTFQMAILDLDLEDL